MSGDFARPFPINQIRDGERIELHADEGDLRRIAARLDLGSLERLDAHATLSRSGDMVRAKGRLQARLTQSCVVTGDPVASHIDEAFELMFVPEPESAGHDAEIELSTSDCDLVFHDGSTIGLGDAVADTLALSVDPYPRSAGAEAALKEAGVLSEAEAGPFAALAKLKRRDSEG